MKQAKTLRWVLGSVSLLGVAMSGTSAMAQTTDNLTVQATVSGSCSVTGGTLDFGTYSGAELDGQTDIGFSCSAPSNVTIQLGGGSIGDPSERQMVNPGNSQSLKYNLFQNATRATLWGNCPMISRYSPTHSLEPQRFLVAFLPMKPRYLTLTPTRSSSR